MTRVAAIDCGTNSVRLLVADVGAGVLHEVDRRMEIVRLGEGVDATGRLSTAALDRTARALDGYAAVISRLGARRVRMVATSATRDAANRDVFVARVRELLGIEPEVVTGDEEAVLSFSGATVGLPADAPAPWLVADIGGGSTELVLGDPLGVTAAVSLDVGCVRLTERHHLGDPPTVTEVAAATADVEAALDVAAAGIALPAAATVVGLAGSVTTLAAMYLHLDRYDPARTHHARLPAPAVARLTRWLLAASRAQRSAVPVMHPGRVDVIAMGALVLDRLLVRTAAAEVVVSEHDILDGIARSIA